MDQAKRCDLWDVDAETAETAETGDWLDAAIGQALRSSFGAAQPAPANWVRIQRRIRQLRAEEASPSEGCTARYRRCQMFSWNDVLAHQERYVDLRREVERERLVRVALNERERRARPHRHMLAWLGQRLVAWGWRLQARYGARAVAVHASSCQPYLVKR
jgi:hypothetical protein